MATYNGESHIREQLNSIQSQSYENWRLIIRDDGSKDDTLNILRRAAGEDKRIIVVEDSIGNLGFNRNFHRLITLSKSPFVMFCDQDDVWLEEKIDRSLSAAILENSRNDHLPLMVHCDSVVADGNLVPIRNSFVRNRATHPGLRAVLLANPAQGATILINDRLRNLMTLHAPEIPYDYQASLFAEAAGRRVFISESLMLYRQHGSNVIGAGASSGQRGQLEDRRSRLNATLALGILGAPMVVKTLSQIRDHWHPNVEREIKRLRCLASEGFSFLKLYYAIRGGYQFYRRKDRINLILYSLGLPSIL